MADIEPPSFSLGLDFDFEPSLNQKQPESSNQNHDDELQWHVSDSDPDSPCNSPPSRFRRLRRGGPSIATPIEEPPPLKTPTNFVEDDIEDFSSEENVGTDHLPASHHQTKSSTSKLSLSGRGVLKRLQESAIQNSIRIQDSSCPSTSVASNKGKSVFPDFSSSPLRMFQLLDSDSDCDDPSKGANINGSASGVDLSKNVKQKELHQGSSRVSCAEKTSRVSCKEKTDLSASTSQKQDLWKDFCVDNNFSVPTPVFDELLEDYCKGAKKNNLVPGSSGMRSSISNAENFLETEALETSGLPCHRYFLHEDYRIQRLVRNRLPYFCPLSASDDTGDEPYNASCIDYRSQFCNGDGAKQNAGRKLNVEKSSKRARRTNKKANIEDDSHTGGTWIDPKQTADTPKDASRRRVRAESQSPGHWLTGDNGKKVYVTKTGKELNGRLAYRQYKKDNGGFKKSGKKRASKKK